ncbi:Sedlin [Polychytrium aggregatum]|uniref:Sedlin n=1 Tax=Polychytrium aggregatum TaxID=110093 RepID=UPI0022FE048E|nr:Sedlin [Polychytrium aggregatum]KAI9193575.1 Sedlin [Polychytrium aggregatum]
MSSTSYFVIVGTKDNPIYEAEFGGIGASKDKGKEEHVHLNQFIVHSALDLVEELQWATQSPYLKVVDRFNEWYVSAYVTPSGPKFMLLHDTVNNDGIRQFFGECHELYLKMMLSPFTEISAPITSSVFDTRVRAAGRKYL